MKTLVRLVCLVCATYTQRKYIPESVLWQAEKCEEWIWRS